MGAERGSLFQSLLQGGIQVNDSPQSTYKKSSLSPILTACALKARTREKLRCGDGVGVVVGYKHSVNSGSDGIFFRVVRQK